MADALAAVKSFLAETGGRWTSAREAVLAVFLKEHRPLAAGEVHRRAAGPVPLASVYRAIEFLLEARVLSRVDHAAGGERFEMSERFREHHHHLICEGCGAVEDLEGCLLEDVERRVRARSRFRVTRHEVNLFGLCAGCGA